MRDPPPPPPRGDARVRVDGGANQVVLRRPKGTEARALVQGAASSVSFDDERRGASAGTVKLATPAFDDAVDRWSIDLSGSASDLTNGVE